MIQTINLALVFFYIGLWIIAASRDYLWRADFSVFYTGGYIVRNLQGAMLYDHDLQAVTQHTILNGRSFSDGLLPFDYPPHVAILFTPFTLIPRSIAFIIWTLLQIGILVWCISLLSKISSEWPRDQRLLMIITVLAFPPLLRNFLLGAFSLLMLACLLQIYLSLKNMNESQAGLWLIVGSLKPQAILFPVAMLLAAKRWKTISVSALIGLMIFTLSSYILGWRIWLDFFNKLLEVGQYFGIYGFRPDSMNTFRGTLTLILGYQQSELINWVSILALLLSVTYVLYLWRRRWDPISKTFRLRFALTLTLSSLFSLHAYQQDSLLLIAPAILFYDYLRQEESDHFFFSIFLLSSPVIFFISDFFIGDSIGIRVPVIMTAILLYGIGRTLHKEHKSIKLKTAKTA